MSTSCRTQARCALALLLSWAGWRAAPAAAVDLELLRPSIVEVSCRDENGSAMRGKGLIVGRQDRLYYVLTARHVVQPGRPCQVEVQPRGRLPVPANLLDKHYDEIDMEVVVFEAEPPIPVAPVEIADAEVGEPVAVLVENRFFDGNKVLSVLATDVDLNHLVIENEGLAETYSGSPVFSAQGKWLGLYRAEEVVLGRRRGLVLRSEVLVRALDFLGAPANLLVRGGKLEARKAFCDQLSSEINDWYFYLLNIVGHYEQEAPATIDSTENYRFLNEAGNKYQARWLRLNEENPRRIREVESLWNTDMAREYSAFFDRWIEGVHERIVLRGLDGSHRGINGVHTDVNAVLHRLPNSLKRRAIEKRRIEESAAKVRADLETLRPELQDQINAFLNRLRSAPF